MVKSNRLHYSFARLDDVFVAAFPNDEWQAMCLLDESAPAVEGVVGEVSGVAEQAVVVAAAVSNVLNPDTSVHVDVMEGVPHVYVVDNVRVVEGLAGTPILAHVVAQESVVVSPELDDFVANHVFVVGPVAVAGRWQEGVAGFAAQARVRRVAQPGATPVVNREVM